MDETSRKAFEITKNVKESNAETLLNVRSGGVVGDLRNEIKQLEAKVESLPKRCDELLLERDVALRKNERLEEKIDKLQQAISAGRNGCWSGH